ncbi:hypothetical protein NMY22_g12177 [Coprinellus aureogranulatus]|nr:hypothetical protein NMY22_g12177 [Coprinellus aureogranulatus]
MSPQDSSFRCVLPYLTWSCVASDTLASQLPPDDHFLPFTNCIDLLQQHPEKYPQWGVYKVQDVILDHDSLHMPKGRVHRLSDDKLNVHFLNGIVMYASCLLLFDKLVHIRVKDGVRRDVLLHPKQDGWIGWNPYIMALDDVGRCVSDFLRNTRSLEAFTQRPQLDNGNLDCSVRLADEITATSRSRNALTSIKNLATVSFAISVMNKGFLQVPDKVTEMTSNLLRENCDRLATLINQKKALGVRRALLLAIFISPLTVILNLDLTKETFCLEELFLNMKRFGNMRPSDLQSLEDDLWRIIFAVAQGLRSASQGIRDLHSLWKDRETVRDLSRAASTFFRRSTCGDCSQPWDVALGSQTCDALPCRLASPTCGGQRHRRRQGTGRDRTSLATAPPNATQEPNDDGGRPAASPASKKKAPKKKPSPPSDTTQAGEGPEKSPRPKRPAKGKQVRSSSTIPTTDDEEDASEDSDFELLDVGALSTLHPEQLQQLQDELAVKLEDCNSFLSSVAVPHVDVEALALDEENSVYSDSVEREFTAVDSLGVLQAVQPWIMLEEDYEIVCDMYGFSLSGTSTVNRVGEAEDAIVTCKDHKVLANSSPSFIQDLFKRTSIVVSNTPGSLGSFDAEYMGDFQDLQSLVTVTDMSVPASAGRLRRARLGDVLTIPHIALQCRKALVTEALTDYHSSVLPGPLASDEFAVRRTRREHGSAEAIPGPRVRFARAMTKGSMWRAQEGNLGNATYIRVECGSLLCILMKPKDSSKSFSIHNHLHDHDARAIAKMSGECNVAMVLLGPGDTIFIQPNTFDLMITLEDAIVRGGFFLATCQLHASVLGNIHTFFHRDRFRVQADSALQSRLNSIAAFFYRSLVETGREGLSEGEKAHIVDYTMVDSLKSLLIFACGIELQNATSHQTYMSTGDHGLLQALRQRQISRSTALESFDLSAMTCKDRIEATFAKGRMVEVVRAVFRSIIIQDIHGNIQEGWDFLYLPMLAWMISSLKKYYRLATAQEYLGGATPPAASLFLRQLDWCARRWDALKTLVRTYDSEPSLNMDSIIRPWPEFTVRSLTSATTANGT